MKALAMAVILFCAEYESYNITRCSLGCERGDAHMLKYSIADGCVCAPRANAEVPK